MENFLKNVWQDQNFSRIYIEFKKWFFQSKKALYIFFFQICWKIVSFSQQYASATPFGIAFGISKLTLKKKRIKKKMTKDFKSEKHVKILNFRPDDIFGQVPNYSLISPKEIWFGLFKLIGFPSVFYQFHKTK